jgi:hypothetical protein
MARAAFSESDRLFARLAVEKNFVAPAHVEEARQYAEKLGELSVPLSIGAVLQKLGRMSPAQVAKVQREMDAFSFPCADCGGKGYRLEFGASETRCERCREKADAAAPPRSAAKSAPGAAAGAAKAATGGAPQASRPASAATGAAASTPPSGAIDDWERTRRKMRAQMFHESARTGGEDDDRFRGFGDARERSPRGGTRPVGSDDFPETPGRLRSDMPTHDFGADSIGHEKTLAGEAGRTDAYTELGGAPRRAVPEAEDPLIGKVVGGAKIEALIGRGGMGSVYRAYQLELERPIAVKVLLPQFTSDPKQVQQFFREAKALAKLDHPNIVTIFNVGKDDETHWIQMQLVDGGSLEHYLRRSGRLPVEKACALIEQAAHGLLEAHAKGIVHRDVKPENMLVATAADPPTVKVTDFGLARICGDQGLTFASDRIVGTPYYMSPEQIDGRKIDSRTDIYALGATFYYLLTGERPFTADTPVDILLKHVNEPVVPPRERRREIPDELSRLVCKMMVKDPDRRYQSLKDVLRDLELARRGQAISVELAPEVKREAVTDDVIAAASRPLVPEPIRVERPRSFYYASTGLGVAAVLAVALLSAPVRAILASGRPIERPVSMADKAVDRELQTFRDMEAKAGPHAAAEAARKLAGERRGSRLAERAERLADELDKRGAAAAKEAADRLLAESHQMRQLGRPGAAIEALLRFPAGLKGYEAEAPLLAEVNAIQAFLEKQRGEAYVPASPMQTGSTSTPARSPTAITRSS